MHLYLLNKCIDAFIKVSYYFNYFDIAFLYIVFFAILILFAFLLFISYYSIIFLFYYLYIILLLFLSILLLFFFFYIFILLFYYFVLLFFFFYYLYIILIRDNCSKVSNITWINGLMQFPSYFEKLSLTLFLDIHNRTSHVIITL